MDEFDKAAHRLARLSVGRWVLVNNAAITGDRAKWRELDEGNDELQDAIDEYARLLTLHPPVD